MDRRNLEFAALLHDIGKFYYRTGRDHSSEYNNLEKEDFGYHGAHSKWSASFIKHYWNSTITDLALYHHNPKSCAVDEDIALIIQKADHHSSGERIDSSKNDPLKTPLLSIFSDILIKPGENKPCDELYVPLKKIDLNRSWNESIPTTEENVLKNHKKLKGFYSDLWDEFENEVKSLEETFKFNTILALLKKYTSNMPSATWGSKPDISLYDHSKTTAAIAVCRYLFNEETRLQHTSSTQEVYSVISGDISGIQNFIFKISSPQDAQSGMSKRLRGRSLYLTLLTDAIANKIVNDLELTQANILFCGGGRFTILAPNTEKAKKDLKKIQKIINEFFIDEFNAELYLAIASEECTGSDLEKFDDITKILAKKVALDKKHKFVDNLNDLFNLDEDLNGKSTCAVCGNLFDKKTEEDKFCESCEEHNKLGSKVTNASYMIKCFFNEDFKDRFEKNKFKKLSFYENVLNIGYIFTGNTSVKSIENTYKEIKEILDEYDEYVEEFEIIKLNDTDFLEIENKFSFNELGKISFSFSFLGNTIPKYHNRNPLYFEHLAQISKGANKLGVLKMDVDDLGMIFGEGFKYTIKNSPDSASSISRISTLSTQLDLFFSGFINIIASEFYVYDEKLKKFFENDLDFFKLNFDEIKLELQNEDKSEDKTTIIVYKEKYGIDLSEEIKDSIKGYRIPTIHINYSGGDDLLVLGPYDDIIEFSIEFRNKFKQWTCNNESINLSGGINIVSSKFPIGKAVNMSETYLEASKSCGKDKLTLFNEVLPWDAKGSEFRDLNELLGFGFKLEEYNSQNKLSKGIIYSMLYLWKDYFEEESGIVFNQEKWEEVNFKKCNGTKEFVPKFAYRLRDMNQNTDEYKTVLKEGIKNMPWIKIPISWVSLRMR